MKRQRDGGVEGLPAASPRGKRFHPVRHPDDDYRDELARVLWRIEQFAPEPVSPTDARTVEAPPPRPLLATIATWAAWLLVAFGLVLGLWLLQF